jgi:hypothetical protein
MKRLAFIIVASMIALSRMQRVSWCRLSSSLRILRLTRLLAPVLIGLGAPTCAIAAARL